MGHQLVATFINDCGEGNVARIRQYTGGIDEMVDDEEGNSITGLISAVRGGHLKAIKVLVNEMGADPNKRGIDWSPPPQPPDPPSIAAAREHYDCLRGLVKEGGAVLDESAPELGPIDWEDAFSFMLDLPSPLLFRVPWEAKCLLVRELGCDPNITYSDPVEVEDIFDDNDAEYPRTVWSDLVKKENMEEFARAGWEGGWEVDFHTAANISALDEDTLWLIERNAGWEDWEEGLE